MKQSKISKSLQSHLTKALFFHFVVVLFLFSTPIFADNILEIYKKFELELSREESLSKKWMSKLEEVKKFYEFLNAKNEELNSLNFSVEVDYKGDRTDEKKLYKIGIGSDISKGIYPNELRFKAGASFQLEDKYMREDVTSMLVNYDHHFKPWLEAYGFVERFSNSYLSIKQRYEIGTGINFELDILDITKKIDKELNTIRSKSEKDYEKFRNIYGNITEEFYEEFSKDLAPSKEDPPDKKLSKDLLRSKFKDLEKEESRIKQAFKKKYAKLSVGLAMTLFSELEQAEIKAYLDEEKLENGVMVIQEATETESILLDMEQKYRFVLRPLVVIRPTDELTLKAFKYFKLPLGNPTENGERDYRTDMLIRAEFNLKKAAGWAEKLSLAIEYQRHFDNFPPRISEEKKIDLANDGKILRGDGIAQKIHDEFKFTLKISF